MYIRWMMKKVRVYNKTEETHALHVKIIVNKGKIQIFF
jgi:hypothetical protein